MENYSTNPVNTQRQQKLKLQLATQNLKWLTLIGLVLCFIALFMFYLNWSCIYNTTIAGNEVSVNGIQYLAAGLTGDFKNPSYGDISVPFYYYAKANCELLSIFTILSFISLMLTILSSIFVFAIKKYLLNAIPAIFSLLTGIFFIVCFGIALSMNNSKILPIYCSGNPACSVQSFAIIPALFSIAAGAFFFITAIKYYMVKTDLQ